jgi:hypothetical protein
MLPPNCLYFLPKLSAPGASLLLRCLRRLKSFMSFIVAGGRRVFGGRKGVYPRWEGTSDPRIVWVGGRQTEGEMEDEGEGERSERYGGGEEEEQKVVEQKSDPM